MMAGQFMNGRTHEPQPIQPMTADTPVAYYQPVAITPMTIKWIAGSILGIIGFLATAPIAEKYVNPAKATDLETLTRVVQIVQTGQAETSKAVERLTVAVDNLASLVDEVRRNGAKLKNAAPRVRIR